MRILFLTSRLPYPPNRGDRLRVFNIIQQLSQVHDLSLISFIAADSEREHINALEGYFEDFHLQLRTPLQSSLSVLRNLWRPVPFQALYYRSSAMHSLVQATLSRSLYDVVYVHLFRMAPYVLNRPDLYRIVDLTDLISREVAHSLPFRDPLTRLIYTLERPRIARYERWVAETFEETWLVSQADRQALVADRPTANIQLVTNGVDYHRFFPTGQPAEPDSLIFVGHLGVFHNVDAARYLAQEILPRVRAQVPSCRLTLVGAEPIPEVRRLGEDPAVTVTGYVPDLNAYLNRAAVFVAPLRFAAGIQNKALEAMAAGKPVVTTSQVNAGLGAQPGVELLIGDDLQEFSQQVVALLRSESLRSQIGSAGLQFVRGKYHWENILSRMEAIQARLAGPQATPRGDPSPDAPILPAHGSRDQS